LKVCVWDLEGPISHVDFAAEIFKMLETRINRSDLDNFFHMISNYDDYLIENPSIISELDVDSYEPGDTLRLLAPFYIYYFSNEELKTISKNNPGLVPGSKDIMNKLKKEWDIYIISTSYTQHAYNIASLVGIPNRHVFCTEFPITSLKEDIQNIDYAIENLIDTIFIKYKKSNLESVIDDLNNFFFKKKSSYRKVMMEIKVRGGRRKESAMVEIANNLNIPISEIIAIGDSITDMNMLKRVRKEGGIAISFNGNQYSIPHANIAVTSPNQMGSLPIFRNDSRIWDFLDDWNNSYNTFLDNPLNIPSKLISKDIKQYFIEKNFVPRLDNLRNATNEKKTVILELQKEMRKKVRGWVGDLG
jgi:energy-converting hydrogenase A subunit R